MAPRTEGGRRRRCKLLCLTPDARMRVRELTSHFASLRLAASEMCDGYGVRGPRSRVTVRAGSARISSSVKRTSRQCLDA